MNEPRFQIGDTVTIRQWDDMAEEYGYCTSTKLSIDVPFRFIIAMYDLCGKRFTIKNIRWNETHQCYEYFLHGATMWSFSAQMFEEPRSLFTLPDDTNDSMGIDIFFGGTVE